MMKDKNDKCRKNSKSKYRYLLIKKLKAVEKTYKLFLSIYLLHSILLTYIS